MLKGMQSAAKSHQMGVQRKRSQELPCGLGSEMGNRI